MSIYSTLNVILGRRKFKKSWHFRLILKIRWNGRKKSYVKLLEGLREGEALVFKRTLDLIMGKIFQRFYVQRGKCLYFLHTFYTLQEHHRIKRMFLRCAISFLRNCDSLNIDTFSNTGNLMFEHIRDPSYVFESYSLKRLQK